MESDSDSNFTPDIGSSPPSTSFASVAAGLLSTSATQHPLSSIAERRTASGEETDEDEEEDEGWKAASVSQPLAPSTGAEQLLDSELVMKAGYLWKKGVRRKTWKKRWFVLRLPHLAYYKSSAEYKVLRLLDLSDVHAVTPCPLKRHSNTFVMVSPSRTFYLQAETDEDLQSWVRVLNHARLSIQSTSSTTSLPNYPNPDHSAPISIPGSSAHASPTVPSQVSHSPPTHNVTSSDSDEASPTAMHPAVQIGGSPVLAPNASPALTQDPTKVVLSGYLMKCASKRRSWRKRWFVLTGEKLVYSGSHMDTRPHRQIALSEILDALEFTLPPGRHAYSPPTSSPSGNAQVGQEEAEGSGRNHTFKIITPKRTLVLCAPSEEEEIKWLSAVRAMRARVVGSQEAVAG